MGAQREAEEVEKDTYTAEELEQQLRKELGDEMANLDVKNLNNGVRLDFRVAVVCTAERWRYIYRRCY